MPTSTYEPIATHTLGSAQASYTFTTIPSTYTDLRLVINGGVTASPDPAVMRFNGDASTNYSATLLRGNGTSAISAQATNSSYIDWIGYFGGLSGSSVSISDIQNYKNTTTFKTVISRGNVAANFVNATVGLWRSTAAISSMTILSQGSTFLAGTTFTLYGILAA